MIWRILIKRVFMATEHRFEEFYQTPEERTSPPMSDRSGFSNAARYVRMIDSIFFSMAANLETEESEYRAIPAPLPYIICRADSIAKQGVSALFQ